MTANPYQAQDRAFDAFDQFDRFGCVMFPQQDAVYRQLGERLKGKIVLEAGCGNGVGTALLDRAGVQIALATDILERNVAFASCLYSWLPFAVWDIYQPPPRRAGVVVCVEAFEHAEDPWAAAKNLTAAAYREVWLSTPNGTGKPRPPSNPNHVQEYTPEEIVEFFALPRVKTVDVLHWQTFARCEPAGVDPLVYRIELEGP